MAERELHKHVKRNIKKSRPKKSQKEYIVKSMRMRDRDRSYVERIRKVMELSLIHIYTVC